MTKIIYSLFLILVFTPITGNAWEKIKYIAPEFIYEDEASKKAIKLIDEANQESFEKAIKEVKAILPSYYTLSPVFEEFIDSGFYQQQDINGSVYLAKLVNNKKNELMLFGQLEYDDLDNKVIASISGYDSVNRTQWKVVMTKFKLAYLKDLKEVYIQLIFDLLNEPSAGLKPLNKTGK